MELVIEDVVIPDTPEAVYCRIFNYLYNRTDSYFEKKIIKSIFYVVHETNLLIWPKDIIKNLNLFFM